MDFSKFDAVNKEVKTMVQNAPEQSYDDVPFGTYICNIEKMEIKQTKAGDKLMFALQLKVKETVEAPKKQDGRYLFFNRVVAGNKCSEKWNDGVAIKGVLSMLATIAGDDDGYEFESYEDLANLTLDIYQSCAGCVELEVKYDAEAFNSVKITNVYDV